MVKLTPELIQQCAQYINPVRDRELDLRGYKIPVIENVGATLDQFDCIDFSDNDIRKVDGFPLLKRLKCILMSNNRVCRIGEHLEESLPNLETLVLTNNHIAELGDIDNLSTVKTLHTLSLLRNPLCSRKHSRLYIIHKLPQVKLLDFRKVRQKEREAAAKLFKGKRGKQLEREIGRKSKTFVPGAAISGAPPSTEKQSGQLPADVETIKNAIKKASTLEEVERLKHMLKSGQFPGKEEKSARGSTEKEILSKEHEQEEEDMDLQKSDRE